jgi:hypothetical protein
VASSVGVNVHTVPLEHDTVLREFADLDQHEAGALAVVRLLRDARRLLRLPGGSFTTPRSWWSGSKRHRPADPRGRMCCARWRDLR